MIGMILCGGYGKRLKPYTEDVPKPLIEIQDNYTILDKQLYDMANAGIDKVILLTGYLSEKIEERYRDNYRGMKVGYSVEEKPLGTLNAIKLAMDSIKEHETIMVRNGDVVSDLNLKKMINKFDSSDYPAVMFVTKMRSPYGIVELGEDHIKSFKEKPFLDYYINGGIYIFDSEIPLGDFEKGEIEKTVFPMLADSNQLGFYKEHAFWMSIDTTKDLEEIKKEYANRVDKPWGYEKTLIITENYLTKEIYIKEDYTTSYHYHNDREESLYMLEGSCYIQFADKKEYFGRNDIVHIPPKTPHKIVATENSLMHNTSTPYIDDIVRIEDYYPAR
jgi:NDP-sugar pyrophosphorylase family protein